MVDFYRTAKLGKGFDLPNKKPKKILRIFAMGN